MRYIPIRELTTQCFSDTAGAKNRKRLFRSHLFLVQKSHKARQKYIRRSGPDKWAPIKNWLTERLGDKCWYTEAELVGAPLAIDHFRPVGAYWWLTFDPANYRVACAFANSPQHNPLHGCAGGKGDSFPLCGIGLRAKGRNKLRYEKPVILDPCEKGDCELLAFQADGRPVLNPAHAADPTAQLRVDKSKILLNLDHPDFNSKREQLCNQIALEVRTYEGLTHGSPQRAEIAGSLLNRLSSRAPFSSAARYYLRLHRHLPWVDQLLASA